MKTLTTPVRVLVVDDHPAICAALRRGLRDVQVVPAYSARGARRELTASSFAAVIADIGLPDDSGLNVVAESANFAIPSIVFTGRDDTASARAAILAGASAYLVKTSPIDEVRLALRIVLEGKTYFSPEIAQDVDSATKLSAKLSDGERRVFLMLGEGLTSKEIAQRLGKSPRTIEARRSSIRSKLEITDLAAFAVRFRLGS